MGRKGARRQKIEYFSFLDFSAEQSPHLKMAIKCERYQTQIKNRKRPQRDTIMKKGVGYSSPPLFFFKKPINTICQNTDI